MKALQGAASVILLLRLETECASFARTPVSIFQPCATLDNFYFIRSSLLYFYLSGVVGISAAPPLREYTSTPAPTEIDLTNGSPTIRRMVTTSDTGHFFASKFTYSVVPFRANRKPCSDEAAQRPSVKKASAAAVSTQLGVGLVSVYVSMVLERASRRETGKE
jgi:hypothetical protein